MSYMEREFRWYGLKLVFICIVIFIFQIFFPSITNRFALNQRRIFLEPYRFITSIFLHGGLEHLMFNMFALGLFGSILEKIIGSKRFLIIFFVSGLISGTGSVIFYSSSIGASGTIFGILGTLTVLRPKMMVWVLGVPMPMFLAAGIWAFMDLIGMFAPTGVANAAHLFGLFGGIGIGIYLRPRFKKEGKGKKEENLPDEEELKEWEREWM